MGPSRGVDISQSVVESLAAPEAQRRVSGMQSPGYSTVRPVHPETILSVSFLFPAFCFAGLKGLRLPLGQAVPSGCIEHGHGAGSAAT